MNSFPNHNIRKQESGFALVTVLLFMFLVAAFITPLAISTRTRMLTSDNNLQFTVNNIKLSGDITLIASWYKNLNDSIRKQKATDGFLCKGALSDTYYRVLNHAGLVDLNTAGLDLLVIAFKSLNMSSGNPANLAKEITTFRSLKTGTTDQFRNTPEHGYKHAPFEAVSELHDLYKLREIKLDLLGNIFTVQKKSSTITSTFSTQKMRTIFKQHNSKFVNTINSSNIITADVIRIYADGRFSRQKKVLRFLQQTSSAFEILSTSPTNSSLPEWITKATIIEDEICSSLSTRSDTIPLGGVFSA